MTDIRLSDEDWGKIREFLRQEPHAYLGRDETSCRHFLDAVKWMSRSGAQWRLLPAEYGAWNSVYKRFVRWCDAGVWERLWQRWPPTPTPSTACWTPRLCAPIPARSARKKHGAQALGRSRGAFSCKIHLTVDGLGNPLRALLTAGQRHDSTRAVALLDGFTFERVIADRGYAGAAFVAHV